MAYNALRALTVLLILGAVSTLIPNPSGTKYCMLGYMAVCSATPMSTFILLLAAGAVHVINASKFKPKADAASDTSKAA
jgi:hypothetical protein